MKSCSVLVLIIAIMSVVSCKKDYNCKCTVSALGIPVYDTTISLGKMKKKDAKSECDDYQNSIETLANLAATMGFGISISADCGIEK